MRSLTCLCMNHRDIHPSRPTKFKCALPKRQMTLSELKNDLNQLLWVIFCPAFKSYDTYYKEPSLDHTEMSQ